MSQPTENVRVRRTRKLLRDALIELIDERGFDRVTVGGITERAMVSRAAFYRNYRDKFHLVEQIFDDAMADLHGSMADAPPGSSATAPTDHGTPPDRAAAPPAPGPTPSGGSRSSSTSPSTTASTARCSASAAARGSRRGCRRRWRT